MNTLKLPYYFILCCLLFSQIVIAQAKKKITKKNIEVKTKIVTRPDSVAPYIVSAKGDTINRTDIFNTKQGLWIENIPEKYGEMAMLKYGMYKDDWKTGIWKMYEGPNLICQQNYKNNVLDGEILYYDNGYISCKGYYTGSNYRNKIDTIILVNAQTQQSKTYYISNTSSFVKDSTWTFYMPNSEKIKSVEYWRNDELITTKEINTDGGIEVDSAFAKKYDDDVKRNQKKENIPFRNDNKAATKKATINKSRFTQSEKLK